MSKKIIGLILVIILIVTAFPVVLAATKPTVTISSCTAKPGENITLSVSIESNSGINTFSFGFDYDTSKLNLVDVEFNDELGGMFTYKKKAVWLSGKDSKYNGRILELKFEVLDTAKNGETQVKVTYDPGEVSNYDEENVDCKIVAGTVTIEEQEVKESFFTKVINFFKKIMSFFRNLFN